MIGCQHVQPIMYYYLFLKRQNCANDVFILFAENKIDIQLLKRLKGFVSFHRDPVEIKFTSDKLQPESKRIHQ